MAPTIITSTPVAAVPAFAGGQQYDLCSLADVKLEFSAPGTWSGAPNAKRDKAADARAEARMKGYVGEACPECANFTLVRNGTCLKCDTCGSTTGCS